MGYILHFFLSSSLVYIGEYTTALFLQIVFIAMKLSKRVFLLLYLPAILLSLSKIFTASSYLLYFLSLSLLLFYLYEKRVFFYGYKFLLFILYITVLLYGYNYFDAMRYEIYLDLNINDTIHAMNKKVIFFLTLLHVIILFIMGYNREKLLRK